MMALEKERYMRLAVAIVELVEPDDVFVVEESFDAIAADWNRAASQDEGRFTRGAEVATFAAAVIPFLLTFLADVAKDIAKDYTKKISAALLEKLLARRIGSDDAGLLRHQIDVAIAASSLPAPQKQVLSEGFTKLFDELPPAS
jgi:hypothetical protein